MPDDATSPLNERHAGNIPRAPCKEILRKEKRCPVGKEPGPRGKRDVRPGNGVNALKTLRGFIKALSPFRNTAELVIMISKYNALSS